MTLKEVQAQLGKKFVFVEEAVAAMFAGYELSTIGIAGNVILFGPKGHGKTQLSDAFLKVFFDSKDIYKAQFSYATKEEHLFGVPIMEDLQKGVLNYNLEGSFLDFKAARFEEFLDAPMVIIQMLKDILESGEYCAGGKACYQSKCKFVVAPTNVDPMKWAASGDNLKRDSYEALIDRFPIHNRVVWPAYTADHYAKMIEIVLNTKSDAFCQMMEKAFNAGQMISPRSAIKMAQSYGMSGIQSLKHFNECATNPGLYEEFVKIDSAQDRIKHINHWLNEAKTLLGTKSPSAKDVKKAIDELNRYPSPDDRLLDKIAKATTELADKKAQMEAEYLQSTLYK